MFKTLDLDIWDACDFKKWSQSIPSLDPICVTKFCNLLDDPDHFDDIKKTVLHSSLAKLEKTLKIKSAMKKDLLTELVAQLLELRKKNFQPSTASCDQLKAAFYSPVSTHVEELLSRTIELRKKMRASEIQYYKQEASVINSKMPQPANADFNPLPQDLDEKAATALGQLKSPIRILFAVCNILFDSHL